MRGAAANERPWRGRGQVCGGKRIEPNVGCSTGGPGDEFCLQAFPKSFLSSSVVLPVPNTHLVPSPPAPFSSYASPLSSVWLHVAVDLMIKSGLSSSGGISGHAFHSATGVLKAEFTSALGSQESRANSTVSFPCFLLNGFLVFSSLPFPSQGRQCLGATQRRWWVGRVPTEAVMSSETGSTEQTSNLSK